MRLWLIKCLIFVIALVGVLQFEDWYFTETIEGIVLRVDDQNRVLVAQNLDLVEEDFNRTYMEWFSGDYDVIEVMDVESVEPGMHISVNFDSRLSSEDSIKVQALDYEVLDVAFLIVETVVPASADISPSSELATIFPQTEGHLQIFSGYADYGHIQKLTFVRELDDFLEIYFEGQMNDALESSEDRHFNLMYQIDENSIVEFIHNRDPLNSLQNEMLFHSIIERKVILKTPLEIGNTWEQTFNFNGRQHTAVTEIVRAEINEDGEMEYETLTRVEGIEGYYNNYYEEKRVFVEGRGMTKFANRQSFEQLGLDPDTATETGNIFIFGFSLVGELQDTVSTPAEEEVMRIEELSSDDVQQN